MAERENIKVVADNRKAKHDYFIEETIEAGIALLGPEVKSARGGKVNLRDGYATVQKDGIFIQNVHISPYEKTIYDRPDPLRPRRLLLHKREIRRLESKVREKGYTMVPLKMYFNPKGIAKIELALAKGKRLHDKRDTISKREAARKIQRAMKESHRGV